MVSPAPRRKNSNQNLNTTPPSAAPILCDIIAPRASHAAVLAEIAATCARDLGQTLQPRTLRIGRRARARARERRTDDEEECVLILRLPAALAGSQHPVWCLACRLACFLPSARVSVLVEAADHFVPSPHSAKARARRIA